MNFRNPKLVGSVRIVFGLFMIFSGISGFMAAQANMQGVPEPMVAAMKVLLDTGIFYLIKVTELVAGLMLVFRFLPQLAAIFLAPVAVGIIIVTARIAPANLVMGFIVSALNAYLGYVYWDSYKALFKR